MLNSQEIENVIISALEGGSNYWYLIKNEDIDEVIQHFQPKKDLSLTESLYKAIENGFEVPIYDREDEDKHLGTLSMANIKKGIQKSIDEGREEVLIVKSGNDDCFTADVLFQYFVLGKIVYG